MIIDQECVKFNKDSIILVLQYERNINKFYSTQFCISNIYILTLFLHEHNIKCILKLLIYDKLCLL